VDTELGPSAPETGERDGPSRRVRLPGFLREDEETEVNAA
jgi:hypothetical protein